MPLKKISAIAATAFGLISGAATAALPGGILIGLGIALPGIWWLLHDSREKRGAEPLTRHWFAVFFVSFLLFATGFFLYPSQESEGKSVSGTVSSSTSSSPPSSPTRSHEVTSESESATKEFIVRETEKAGDGDGTSQQGLVQFNESDGVGNDDTSALHYTAQPEREEETPPYEPQVQDQPVYEQPSREEQAEAYYRSCSDAWDAGAAPPLYQGDPGYRSGLDRDGDGIACEPKQ